MTMDLFDMRQKLADGDLKHEEIEELLTLAENQQAIMADLEKQAELNRIWTRTHYRGRQKAEKDLLESVRRVVQDSARLARNWPKRELASLMPGGKKPTKEQVYLARAVANGIAVHIENQVQGE